MQAAIALSSMHKPFFQTVVGTLVLGNIKFTVVTALSTRSCTKRCLQTVIYMRQKRYHICFTGGHGAVRIPTRLTIFGKKYRRRHRKNWNTRAPRRSSRGRGQLRARLSEEEPQATHRPNLQWSRGRHVKDTTGSELLKAIPKTEIVQLLVSVKSLY